MNAEPEAFLVFKPLEEADFKIESEGWSERWLEDGTRVKINPEGDVTELVDGKFAGHQHFTWEAAMRETAKSGKRLPSYEEWASAILVINPELDPDGGWQKDATVREALRLGLPGYLLPGVRCCHFASVYGHYWSSSDSGGLASIVALSSGYINFRNYVYKEGRASVRCLKG